MHEDLQPRLVIGPEVKHVKPPLPRILKMSSVEVLLLDKVAVESQKVVPTIERLTWKSAGPGFPKHVHVVDQGGSKGEPG